MTKDKIIEELWKIIDDIDTYSDMAKSDDKLYRSLVEKKQDERWKLPITTDEYGINIKNNLMELCLSVEEMELIRALLEIFPINTISHPVESGYVRSIQGKLIDELHKVKVVKNIDISEVLDKVNG